jgi:hypothetical protein
MSKIGDEVKTSDGEVYLMVSKEQSPTVVGNADLNTIAQLLDQVNINLNILIDTNRWVGSYISIEDNLEHDIERSEYVFRFPIRYMRLYADQPIRIQFNDIGNPLISISASEMPYVLPNLTPGFIIEKLFVSTGSLTTKLKILAMG